MKTTRLEATTVSEGGLDKSTVEVIAARPFVGAAAERYEFLRNLGSGGFGDVFLAKDKELQRLVAIKLWHRQLDGPDGLGIGCLEEARTVAKLDHPAIVPVYDMGTTRHGTMFIVSKYIEGEPLALTLRHGPLGAQKSADIVAIIARALNHAHGRGLIHRDVKPANILIDTEGKPYLIDFGIAMREELLELDTRIMGTPAYMSPEQARGEGHLVNRRSDVFSLGVVLYEMLTGKRAFPGDTVSRVLASVESGDPAAPSAIDANVGRQLDRICTKAIAKRARDRYASCAEFAEDLESFLKEKTAILSTRAEVVPKGLRAFDADDSDFFLELLPGPRDRMGLPESLRLWKQRIEGRSEDEPFRVGMLYGPSGCGKSSFVRAGLLPQLGAGVLSICIEADATATEERLQRAIMHAVPDLDPRENLAGVVGTLRRRGVGGRQKLLVVIDQFEQWLNANAIGNETPLIQALRQCDGTNIQCLCLVRDDFWLTASRFMEALEVDLNQNTNVGMVDLFDLEHAELVLERFGRAHHRLPKEPNEESRAFLKESAEDLAENGRIVPVRLAVFAEMMKSREWTSDHLARIGGAKGLGRAFLDDALGDKASNPFLRQHQNTVKQLLKQLLPEVGTNIKGAMKSFDELREHCEKPATPDVFRKLIKSLDQELKLITPADISSPEESVTPSTQYYQLTHDFLVPAIREWLAGQQQSTRQGRAQLLLEQRSQAWASDRRNGLLPDSLEWLRINLHTARKTWNRVEHEMMTQASRNHLKRALVYLFALLAVSLGIRESLGRIQGKDLASRIVESDIQHLPDLATELVEKKRWTLPYLEKQITFHSSSPEQTKLRLALLAVTPEKTKFATGFALQAAAHELAPAIELLRRYGSSSYAEFQGELHNTNSSYRRRLRAAACLSKLQPSKLREDVASVRNIASWLIREPLRDSQHWVDLFRPLSNSLREPLTNAFHTTEQDHKVASGVILARSHPQDVELLVELLSNLAPSQLTEILSIASISKQSLTNTLIARFNPSIPKRMATSKQRELYARRQASLGLSMANHAHLALPLSSLTNSPDPRYRFSFIHGVSDANIDPSFILSSLAKERRPSVKQALLAAMGDYSPGFVTPADQERLIAESRRLLRDGKDAGVHSMAEWLLQTLNRKEEIERVKADSKYHSPSRIRDWFVNSQGCTFSIMRSPQEFTMGSTQKFSTMRYATTPVRTQIPRSFAISTKEITVGQFARFAPDMDYTGSIQNHPTIRVSHSDAMRYCLWLSKRENVPDNQHCYYETNNATLILPYADMLQRSGYRLPTEAEWEYCARAGTTTTRPYGDSIEILKRYEWTYLNAEGQKHGVGTLRPNQFGLFDMLGNAAEWCQDRFNNRSPSQLYVDDKVSISIPNRRDSFVVRGDPGRELNDVTSFSRSPATDTRMFHTGFRVARTLLDW